MAKAGAFHRKHGVNIRLLEDETIAHRVDSYNKAVVFTAQAIPLGGTFQVKLLDKGGGWAGSIVSQREGDGRYLGVFTRGEGHSAMQAG